MADQGSSERSPLLKPDGLVSTYLESGEATTGALPAGSGLGGHAHVRIPAENAGSGNGEEEALLEGQSTAAEADPGQYEGLEDVRKQLIYIIPACALGILLAALDLTVVAAAAGRIGSDLNALKSTSWIATSYFLTLTSFQPLYGKLSDIFGRKTCILSAYLIFSIGSLGCGLSSTIEELIISRAVAGIGGGGMTTCVSILMSDIIPLRERGVWQGVMNLIFAFGSGIGAPLGGLLSDTIGWKWAFLAQVPLCLLAFVLVFFALQLPEDDKGHWRTKLRRVDFLGAVVLVAAVTILLVGLDQGSNVSWESPITITFLALSAPLFGSFIWIEQRMASEPFAPGRIIFERSRFSLYMSNFFSFAGWYGTIFYLPLYYQAVENLNATQGGERLLPGIVASVTGSLLSGLVMQKTGKFYWLNVASWCILCIGVLPILFFTGTVLHSTLGISIGLAAGGLGQGSGVTVSLIALISSASSADQAVVTANSYLFRSLGSVLGLSLQSALFQNLLRVKLHDRLGNRGEADKLVDRIRQSLDYARNLDPNTKDIVRTAYAESTTGVFWLVLFLTILAFIFSFFVREVKLGSR